MSGHLTPRGGGRRRALPTVEAVRAGVERAVPVVAGLYIATAFLGLVVAPLATSLLEAPVAGVLLSAAYVTAHRTFLERWPSRPTLYQVGLLTYGAPLFARGAGVLDQVGSALTLVVLLTAAVLLRSELGRAGDGSPTGEALDSGGGWAGSAEEDEPLRGLLSALSIHDLFDEWHAVQVHDSLLPEAAGSTAERLRIRRLLIEELRRRGPVGVARWLTHGPQGRPEDYIQDSEPPGL